MVSGSQHSAHARHGLTRRRFLGSLGVAAGGLGLPTGLWSPPSEAAATTAMGFGGGRPLRAAMHVHGSWSERDGSWEAQLFQAAAHGYDLLYLTDHDRYATAAGFATSLAGLDWNPAVWTGELARSAAGLSNGSVHLLAESAAATRPASVALSTRYRHNKLRTSVSGLTIKHRVGSVRLTHGATYELVLTLSYHSPMAGRPAGRYRLVYRFGTLRPRRWREDGGLTGVVGLPAPQDGSVQTLVPVRDIAAIWPDMLAIDNNSYALTFQARSPKRGAVCKVDVRSVRFIRSRSSAADVIADQARLLTTYRSRFPSVTMHASIETSRSLPDMNVFGVPQWLPDYSSLSQDRSVYHQQISDSVHAMGGLVSWNHPFGSTFLGPVLGRDELVARRRQVFGEMQAVGRFGADILEVGYHQRGLADCPTHLDLWDTFSRNGSFMTGNGVSDNHTGRGWAEAINGFATGVWAPSTSQADVVAALAAGRAYVAHASRWPGALDLLVDDAVPMGAVSVSGRTSRSLAIWATDLPSDSMVQVVGGPVDYAGNPDPGTSVLANLSPASFATGSAAIRLDTSASQFFRVQVLDSDGQVLGSSNPVWLLRSEPPGGVPAARRAT